MVSVVRVLEPRVLELVERCVDGQGWGWGGMIGGIDEGGDAVIWVEETEAQRGGSVGEPVPGTCRAVVGNETAVGNGGEDVVLTSRDHAVLD